ncbi:hypothetical protein NRA63_00830 [Acinetobacter baumannii]|uniref:hypothetical protein n=1 Tax=Acinetobacter baumannii TaxID=470 RepID=UPI000BF60C7C|nr:hypothetical protein [Acinetobacter baumannii]MDC5100841.1 hypothetical protein [Acinetobacter baumannii]MDC5216647.1 hypothetical protein [Acinetobacter baumannii]MDC5583856.1 hypothetical protein [Acinetobacter baumannii]
MSDCNKAGHQIDPLELFEIFFTSITPEMTPIGIRSHGMQATHHFWKQRFINVFRGIPEEKGLDQFSDLPILWLSAWKHQQEKVEEANAKAQMCRHEKNHAINRWSAVCKERDELQKQVETARELVAGIKDGFFGECFEVNDIAKKLEQALKV